jgi:phosphate transport system substrate-binding protein
MNKIQRVLVVILTVFFVLSSFTVQAAKELNWVGCGISKKAYVTSLSKLFEKETGIHINLQGGGATKGIREVVSQAADLGGSCRYRLPYDPREAGVGLEPVAWDALVVIVNKENPVSAISLQDVKNLFNGKIKNWKQLGGNDAPVEIYTRKSKNSGVGRTLRKNVFADFDKVLYSTKQFKSSGPLEKGIMANKNAIAVTGISSARLRDVKILKLDGIAPTVANIKAGKYKIYRPLYITYNHNSPRLEDIKKFIKFCHSKEGRDAMKENGVVPYKEALVLIMKQIEQDDSAFKRGLKADVKTE